MAATLKIWDTYASPASNAGMDLGSDALEFNDIWIDGVAYLDSLVMHGALDMNDEDITSIDKLEGIDTGLFIDMGQNSQIIISSDGAGTPFSSPDIDITGSCYFDDHIGLTLDKQLQFGDTGVYIFSDDNAHLDLEADTSIDFRINTTEQIALLNGILQPTTDNDIDFGTTALAYKNAYIHNVEAQSGYNVVCNNNETICNDNSVVVLSS